MKKLPTATANYCRPTIFRQLLWLLFAMCFLSTSLTAEIQTGFGILFLDHEAPSFDTRIAAIANKDFPELDFTKSAGDSKKIRVETEWVDIGKFPVPKPEAFELFALGLEPVDRDRILASKRTIFLNFSYPERDVQSSLHTISKFIGAITKDVPAAIWDDETRQILSGSEWRKKRIDSWIGGQINVGEHITMHAYRDPQLVRTVTLGLRKFGLPDLVLEGIPWELSRPAGNTINYCAQTLLENGFPEKHVFILNLGKIRHRIVREKALENQLEGAIGVVGVGLFDSKPEKGDPDNRQFRIDFPEMEATDASERAARGLAALYGSEKTLLYARHNDEELVAARDRARKIFFSKKELFRAGLKPNERLAVKYGFTDGKNTEYMWLEVYGWDGDKLSGIVSDDSYNIEGVKAGQKVTIPVGDIYDYLHYHADGAVEGNETGKILESREKK